MIGQPYFCKSVDSVIFLVSFLVSFSVVPERVNSRVGWLLGVLYMIKIESVLLLISKSP